MNHLQNQLDNLLQEAQRHTIGIEEYAKKHVDDTPENIEKELNQRFRALKNTVNEQLSAIQHSVFQHAPKPNDHDYDDKKARYKEFLSGASSGLKRISQTFDTLLNKLGEAISKIMIWIMENLPNIITCIAILFEKVIFPVMSQKII